MKTLVTVDWVGVPLSLEDYIQSYLVEHPDSYYMSPSFRWLFYLTRDYGMLQMFNDFSSMDEQEISDFIVGVVEMLYK